MELPLEWRREKGCQNESKCFKVWRPFLLSSYYCSFQICITEQAWGQYHWIYGQIPFLHFARLCRSPLFFLVGYAMRLRRSLRDLMHWSSLCSLLRTDEWSTCSKSSILFTETKSRQMKKERHQYPVILTEQAWSKRVYLFMDKLPWFLFTTVCLAVIW